MITVYKVSGDVTKPESVQCEKPGWPNRDVNGDEMYENSHFITEAEAWDSLFRNRNAHLSIMAMRQRDLEKQLQDAIKKTAEAGCLLAETEENFKAWQREQNENDMPSDEWIQETMAEVLADEPDTPFIPITEYPDEVFREMSEILDHDPGLHQINPVNQAKARKEGES